MTLGTMLKLSSNINEARGKRLAYLKVLSHITSMMFSGGDVSPKEVFDSVYSAVAEMDEQAKVEYETAKAEYEAAKGRM